MHEAELAYDVAKQVDDQVIMAHSRILQCKCAREQHARDEATHFALEAYALAAHTDNRRVRTRALIWKAMTEADPPRQNYSAAEEHMEAARGALRQWRAESRVGSSTPAGKHQI